MQQHFILFTAITAMQIQLNGKDHDIKDVTSLSDLVQQLDLAGKRFAIEVNDELVPRSQHAQHFLQANDNVEVVQAIGGG